MFVPPFQSGPDHSLVSAVPPSSGARPPAAAVGGGGSGARSPWAADHLAAGPLRFSSAMSRLPPLASSVGGGSGAGDTGSGDTSAAGSVVAGRTSEPSSVAVAAGVARGASWASIIHGGSDSASGPGRWTPLDATPAAGADESTPSARRTAAPRFPIVVFDWCVSWDRGGATTVAVRGSHEPAAIVGTRAAHRVGSYRQREQGITVGRGQFSRGGGQGERGDGSTAAPPPPSGAHSVGPQPALAPVVGGRRRFPHQLGAGVGRGLVRRLPGGPGVARGVRGRPARPEPAHVRRRTRPAAGRRGRRRVQRGDRGRGVRSKLQGDGAHTAGSAHENIAGICPR